MKLLVLNPNTTESVTERLAQAAQEVCTSNTTICADQVSFGAPAITTELDEFIAQAAVLKYLDQHVEKYDGVIVGCFGDPGVKLAKKRYPVPILGIAESAYHMACLTGSSFHAISTGSAAESSLTWDMIARCGLTSRCRGVHPLGLELTNISDSSLPRVETAILQIMEGGGCDCIVLACAALAGMGQPLIRKFGIPIFDGVQQATMLMEGMMQKEYSAAIPLSNRIPFTPLPLFH